MLIRSHEVPSVTTSLVKHDRIDLEPDEAWKDTLRKRIEEGLKSMMGDATWARDNQLASIPPNDPRQEGIWEGYDKTIRNIVNLVKEEFQVELDRERRERRWSIGRAMTSHVLKSEQQEITDRTKEIQKESSSPVSRKAITSEIVGPSITETIRGGAGTVAEILHQAWTLNSVTPEGGIQGPLSPDRQHDASLSHSSPSSFDSEERSDVMGWPPPNTPNSKVLVLSLQDRDQGAHPPPAWPKSRASFNEDHGYHTSGQLSYQLEERSRPWSSSWLPARQLSISPPQRFPSENRPTLVEENSFIDYPSYAAPEGLYPVLKQAPAHISLSR